MLMKSAKSFRLAAREIQNKFGFKTEKLKQNKTYLVALNLKLIACFLFNST